MKMYFKQFVARPVAQVAVAFYNFFETAPDLKSPETVRKLRNREEAAKFLKEVKEMRMRKTNIQVNY